MLGIEESLDKMTKASICSGQSYLRREDENEIVFFSNRIFLFQITVFYNFS